MATKTGTGEHGAATKLLISRLSGMFFEMMVHAPQVAEKPDRERYCYWAAETIADSLKQWLKDALEANRRADDMLGKSVSNVILDDPVNTGTLRGFPKREPQPGCVLCRGVLQQSNYRHGMLWCGWCQGYFRMRGDGTVEPIHTKA